MRDWTRAKGGFERTVLISVGSALGSSMCLSRQMKRAVDNVLRSALSSVYGARVLYGGRPNGGLLKTLLFEEIPSF